MIEAINGSILKASSLSPVIFDSASTQLIKRGGAFWKNSRGLKNPNSPRFKMLAAKEASSCHSGLMKRYVFILIRMPTTQIEKIINLYDVSLIIDNGLPFFGILGHLLN